MQVNLLPKIAHIEALRTHNCFLRQVAELNSKEIQRLATEVQETLKEEKLINGIIKLCLTGS